MPFVRCVRIRGALASFPGLSQLSVSCNTFHETASEGELEICSSILVLLGYAYMRNIILGLRTCIVSLVHVHIHKCSRARGMNNDEFADIGKP